MNSDQKILLTGASGFIGKHLQRYLQQLGLDIRAAVRTSNQIKSTDTVLIKSIAADTDWSAALESVDIVIHLAACAHQIGAKAGQSIGNFNTVNNQGTANLAKQAATSKVKRFVYLSSVKVYGDTLPDDVILTEESLVGVACDAYGLSKLHAEQALVKIAETSAMEFVIIRAPLVYGPGVKANFRSLFKLLDTSLPMPFQAIANKRSMIAIDNMTSFIRLCAFNKDAANQIYLVSDQDDVSLPRLIKLIRKAMGKPVRLFKLPLWLLKCLALLLGKSAELDKLVSSIQLDVSKANTLLNWQPEHHVQDSIAKTVRHYLESKEC